MTDILAVATIRSVSNIEKDAFVNTFAFTDAPDTTDNTLLTIGGGVVDFYTVVAANALVTMESFFGPQVATGAVHTVDLFDITGKLHGEPHGSPKKTYTFNLDGVRGGGGVGLPSEVAVAITLEGQGRSEALVEVADGADADAKRDRPKQRHTGRIFFGPLNISALVLDGSVVRPSEAILDTARLAVEQLHTHVSQVVLGDLGIWSRKDGVIRTIEAVSVDNAFDIQRRRGEGPTTRQRTMMQ